MTAAAPGEGKDFTVLQALKLLTPLIRKLGPNANPGKLKELPVKGGLMWAFFAGNRLPLACRHVSCTSDNLFYQSMDGTSFSCTSTSSIVALGIPNNLHYFCRIHGLCVLQHGAARPCHMADSP